MKAKTWQTVGGAILILWVLMLITGNVKFVAMGSAEAVGYNVGQLILPIAGIAILLSGRKKKDTIEPPKT